MGVESFDFDLNGINIKTTIVTSVFEHNVVGHHISRFERQVNDYNNDKTKFFGFDTQWRVNSGNGYFDCAISLCDGNSCLIIPFRRSPCVYVPQSLANFLSHPNYTFVGIGIKRNVKELKKACGIECRNAVELAPWAARVLSRNFLNYSGVDEIARAVCRLDLRNHRPLCTDFVDWGQSDELNRELVKHATINVVSYQKIGIKLFSLER